MLRSLTRREDGTRGDSTGQSVRAGRRMRGEADSADGPSRGEGAVQRTGSDAGSAGCGERVPWHAVEVGQWWRTANGADAGTGSVREVWRAHGAA
jgi:hypothetical protein